MRTSRPISASPGRGGCCREPQAVFGHLKTDADRLAAAALRLRGERDARAKRGYEILRRRIGSPPGLALCFGAGVVLGARSRHGASHGLPAADERRRERGGGFGRWLQGPAGAAAIKVAGALLSGALLHPDDAPPAALMDVDGSAAEPFIRQD